MGLRFEAIVLPALGGICEVNCTDTMACDTKSRESGAKK